MQLGITAKDKITGFQGVVTAYCQYISGCHQVLLTPPHRDSANNEPKWFDVQRMVVQDHIPTVVLDNGDTPGCDMQAPIR